MSVPRINVGVRPFPGCDKFIGETPKSARCSLHADDFAIWVVGLPAEEVARTLHKAIDLILQHLTSCGFTLSPTKTVAIIFTRRHRPPRINLLLHDKPIAFVTSTKFAEMVLNQPSHAPSSALEKLSLRWGADRKTHFKLHQSLVLFRLDYGNCNHQ